MYRYKSVFRWLIILVSFGIVCLILWNTYIFFQKLKDDERKKMQLWATAQQDLIKNTDIDQEIGDLPLEVIQFNTSTPILQVNADGSYNTVNFEDEHLQDSIYLKKIIAEFSAQNTPIEVTFDNRNFATIYYANSPIINKLKYYPLALLLILFLFGGLAYFFYKSSASIEQNRLWVGMAKETAHQIGTPLSSLIGWVTVLESAQVPDEYLKEMEKDIHRLKTITDRFSKIGSEPLLKNEDIVSVTAAQIDYLKSRSSKLIKFQVALPETPIRVLLNKTLYGWVLENLIKNGIDAMKGKGELRITVNELNDSVQVNITDTGKGIPKRNFKKIFEPGFTTKSRGWGLGLSLARRIIEQYHSGKIKVQYSEPKKGTCISLRIPKLSI
ncbi:MAG: HAMP domain-containing sensor histidine kinase [Flavobacteriaceae bacterium]|nr:HAMP domain-containing sensor histidine kinase [Flavobacteriaceae bacterium]